MSKFIISVLIIIVILLIANTMNELLVSPAIRPKTSLFAYLIVSTLIIGVTSSAAVEITEAKIFN
jgi:hypothetical protein